MAEVGQEGTSDDFSVFVEVKEKIHAAHIVLGLQDVAEKCKEDASKITVTVQPDSIEVNLVKDKKRQFKVPNISLVPNSCHSLQWIPGEGLHMRVQTRSDDTNHSQPIEHNDVKNYRHEIEYLESENCQLSCRVCNTTLLRPNCQFERVLPLPSENWQELVDDWCCHHNDTTEKMKKASMVPRATDCFISDLYLSLNMAALRQDKIASQESTLETELKEGMNMVIICQVCRCPLGEAKLTDVKKRHQHIQELTESVKFYKHCINLNKNSLPLDVFKSYTLESYFARYITTQSSVNTSYKFILEGQDTATNNSILIWLMNTDSKIMMNVNSISQHAELSKLMGSINYERNGTGVKKSLQTYSIIKLFYQAVWDEANRSVLDQWKKDNTVHRLYLPSYLCHQLLLLLINNTQHLPKSMRNTENNFQVGFLKIK
ncbi:E3 ubiquitin-protein ligase E3D-like [Saccoglossus kowalevskii]|uniref:E3 ubiquitin-protein ligase E3D n=1 Tax=Saccoglossus kowalevskii TaxID=10224 RepID=A0ABM0MSH7_SACKO|nr:PREDICTED: E3 ubiquitin-protein ligase E3D-like [Saccoglossus kowalevskii]